MHFTGRTWRPPYEAHSVIIQATSGCTYNKCKFCSLYKNECFRMSPIEEFEEDLAEIKSYQPNARRIFWTGANPFAMSYENLKLRALTVRDYLIKCQTMAMFASIRDIKNKEVWHLRKLRAMGINGLSIGVESGDAETLAFANKGYTSADILEQCRKLDEAGIEYYFVYMTGLAGKNLKLTGGDLKSVQGDSGHAQVKMVADVYSHIIDDDRRLNAQRFEEQFYQTKETPQAEEAQQNTEPSVSSTDQEMLLKLLANPEMATLLKSLAKNL